MLYDLESAAAAATTAIPDWSLEPQQQEEEEEQECPCCETNNVNEDAQFFFLKQPDAQQFELATRIFYATLQKFARQGCPEYKRRSPYSFLESWHLHGMYSKAQQVLLGIPNAQPMVFLSGDDLLFTPPLVQQEPMMMEQYHRMEFGWDDDEDDYMEEEEEEEDEQDEQQHLGGQEQHYLLNDSNQQHGSLVMADDGVMIMTAPAPEHERRLLLLEEEEDDDGAEQEEQVRMVLDENAWMKKRHTNDDTHFNNHHYHELVPSAPCMEENDAVAGHGLTISSDLVNWYRAGHRRPSTIMEHPIIELEKEPESKSTTTTTTTSEEEEDEEEEEENTKSSYQSLADIISTSSAQPTVGVSEDYGTIVATSAPNGKHTQHQEQEDDMLSYLLGWRLLGTSEIMVRALLTAYQVAEEFVVQEDELDAAERGGKSNRRLVRLFACVLRVWQILFVCAESLLGSVGPRRPAISL